MNKEIKYVEKNRRLNNEVMQEDLIELVLRVLVEGFFSFQVIFYFLKQIKNNTAWQTICLDNVFFLHSK